MKKENISLTLSLQFDNFITCGQGRENKNLVFFPTSLLKREKEYQTHKARVMQATQAITLPKLALHMLSANAHEKALYILFSLLICFSNISYLAYK